MRKVKVAFVALMVAIVSMAFWACGEPPAPSAKINAPENLAITGSVLSWTAVADATKYSVVVGDSAPVEVSSVTYDLKDKFTNVGQIVVSVTAANDSLVSEKASVTVTVAKLATPIITITELDGAQSFSWVADSNASKYMMKINDGEWTETTATSFTPTKIGSNTIMVMSVGKMDGLNVQLNSDESTLSDAIIIKEPSIDAPKNLVITGSVLSWTAVPTAIKYSVVVGENPAEEVTGVSFDLSGKFTNVGDIVVSVTSTDGTLVSEKANITVVVAKLATPIVSIVENGGARSFSWAAISGAEKYSVKVNDGEWTEQTATTYTPTGTGDYAIKVKCVGVMNGASALLASDESIFTGQITIYLAKYTSTATARESLKLDTSFSINNVVRASVTLAICSSSGDNITGNGAEGGRFIEKGRDGTKYWIISSPVDGNDSSFNPDNTLPTTEDTMTVEGDFILVADGKLELIFNNFGEGEIVGVKTIAVTKLGNGIDVSSYEDMFVSNGENGGAGTPGEIKNLKTTYALNQVVEATIKFNIMDLNGNDIAGDGVYARRIIYGVDEKIYYIISKPIGAVEGSSFDPINHTLPKASDEITLACQFIVKANGEIPLKFFDFGKNEVLAIKSMQLTELTPIDFTQYQAHSIIDTIPSVNFTMGTNLTEGDVADVTIEFYVCNVAAQNIVGNGGWGRRVAFGDEIYWIVTENANLGANKSSFDPANKVLPKFTDKMTVTTKMPILANGKLEFSCIDFNIGEVLLIKTLTATKFVEELPYIDYYTTKHLIPKFATTCAVGSQVNVTLDFVVTTFDDSNVLGNISGNGIWGRRIQFNSEYLYWIIATNVGDFESSYIKDGAKTIPTATDTITVTFQTTVVEGGFVQITSFHDFYPNERVGFTRADITAVV